MNLLQLTTRLTYKIPNRLATYTLMVHKNSNASFISQQQYRQFSFWETCDTVYKECLAPDCLPIEIMSGYFQLLHTYTGLPWWGVVIGGTLVLRTAVTMPLYVMSLNSYNQLMTHDADYKQKAQDVIKEKIASGKKSLKEDDTIDREILLELMTVKKDMRQQLQSNPFMPFLSQIIQFPLWIVTSYTFRGMCGYQGILAVDNIAPVAGFETGGTLWFSNLLLPDPTMIIPIAAFLCMVVNFEIYFIQAAKVTRGLKIIRSVVWGLSSLLLFSGYYVPVAMPLYWFLSSGHQLALHLCLKSPNIQGGLGMVVNPKASFRPYVALWKLACDRYFLLKPCRKPPPSSS